jgi:hypothetical protein
LSPQLSRFSAVSGIASGLLLAVAGAVSVFTGKTAGAAFVIALAPALALPLLVAVYQRHAAAGTYGVAAFGTSLIGLGLFGGAVFVKDTTLFYLTAPVQDHLRHEPTIVALLGAAVVFVAGTVMFGTFLMRTRAYPRLLPWAYIVFPSLLALLSPLHDSPLVNANHVLAGATITWLALTLWRAAPDGAAAQRRAGSLAGADHPLDAATR